MAWWTGHLKKEMAKMPPEELARVVGDAIEGLSNEQFLAAASALKRDGQRRGLVPKTASRVTTGG